MDKARIIQQLIACSEEIKNQRKTISNLRPKAEAYEVLSYTIKQSMRLGGEAMGRDTAWEAAYLADELGKELRQEELAIVEQSEIAAQQPPAQA